MLRVGLFGGSFDPVHYGHLLLAETARESLGLDRVIFVPTYRQPLKPDRQPAPDQARYEMLQLALAGEPRFAISRVELDRGGISYTVDTLSELTAEKPTAKWYLVMGADSLNDFPRWREPQRILEMATLAVVRRMGTNPPDWSKVSGLMSVKHLSECQAAQIEMPGIEFSSSDIRLRIEAGRSIRYRTPRAVEEYLLSHGLYRPPHKTA